MCRFRALSAAPRDIGLLLEAGDDLSGLATPQWLQRLLAYVSNEHEPKHEPQTIKRVPSSHAAPHTLMQGKLQIT